MCFVPVVPSCRKIDSHKSRTTFENIFVSEKDFFYESCHAGGFFTNPARASAHFTPEVVEIFASRKMFRRIPARSAIAARDTIVAPHPENWAAAGPVSGAAAQPSFRAAGRPRATGPGRRPSPKPRARWSCLRFKRMANLMEL